MNVSNVRQIKLKIIFFSKVLPSKWNPAASWTYKNKEMNVSQRSLNKLIKKNIFRRLYLRNGVRQRPGPTKKKK